MSQHGYPERLSGRSKVLQEDGICQPTIELLVESLTGSAFQMTVSPNDTVYLIKTKIFRVEGIPISQQHLLYNFKELDDSASLNDYSIKDGCTLKLVLSIKGGPISTRRLPLHVDDEIHWRDIRDFVENNREEALEWLPPGCKVLVFKDGDSVNVVKVIEEEEEVESYSPLTDYSFTEETALTMCKMIDLRCKMESLSMKRNKKKHSSSIEKDMKKKSPMPLKKTLSEETLSSTINGLFDETPNFTKYKANRFHSNDSHPRSLSTYSAIFHSDTSYGKFANESPLNDKYGHWPPIGSYSDLASNDSAVSSASRAWRTAREATAASPADYLIRPANVLRNDAADRYNSGSILANASNALPSYMNGNVNMEADDIDAFRESGSSKSVFLGERSLIQADGMETDSMETSNVLTANLGASAAASPLVIESSSAIGSLQLPSTSTSQRSMLLTHLPNAGHTVHGEYATGRLPGDETESSAPDRFDGRSQYYYHQPTSGAPHLKRLPRSVVFGSNSHLNNFQEARGRRDGDKTRAGERPTGSSPGSEPHLNRLHDLQEEKVPKKNSNLSHSVSNLYLDSHGNAEPRAPHGDFSSRSELDEAEDAKGRRVSAAKPGSMIFSSSTSDLLNLKRNRILPSLSRHRNCEHLDASDERLDKVDIVKRENLHYRPENETVTVDAATYGGKLKNGCETCGSSERMPVGRNPTDDFHDGRFGRAVDAPRSLRGVQLLRSEDSADRHFGDSKVSLKNLEVGSERRCRRVKKIPKIDRSDFHDHKNRADSAARRQFMVGCGQGYEAVIQKMSNNCRVRIRDRFDGKSSGERDRFAPLYKRCDTRGSAEMKSSSALDEFNSIRPGRPGDNSQFLNKWDASGRDARDLPPLIVASGDSLESKGGGIEGESGKKPRVRCAMCKKRLSVASVHTCRCGVIFCAPHRYKEIHGCRYDYKAEGQEYLRRANPLVSAPKLPKI